MRLAQMKRAPIVLQPGYDWRRVVEPDPRAPEVSFAGLRFLPDPKETERYSEYLAREWAPWDPRQYLEVLS